MNFKDQVERDLTAVFHNSREHADVVEYGGQIPLHLIFEIHG